MSERGVIFILSTIFVVSRERNTLQVTLANTEPVVLANAETQFVGMPGTLAPRLKSQLVSAKWGLARTSPFFARDINGVI
jgi:hypothetical protein